ncbi:MAG: methyl-accepting chemotaxis protein [Proteobacteria bacterium]|nr:methyl-accepting chemotaxis protein [Pseudomonadota bacterium]
MKLHIKLSLALVGGLVIIVGIAQLLLYYQAVNLISRLSQDVVGTMKLREQDFARDIFTSMNRAVAGSLERGEMTKFSRLLAEQLKMGGDREFCLYSLKGVVTHSSDPRLVGQRIPDDLSRTLLQDGNPVFRHLDGIIEIYEPQMVNEDCVRCHRDWTVGQVGGVTAMRFPTLGLTKALARTDEVLGDASRTFLLYCILTLVGVVAFFLFTMYFSVGRFVRKPLERVIHGLTGLAQGEGDLTRRLPVTSRDELGLLANLFNSFLEKLQFMVGQIQRSGMQVVSSSTELAATARQQETTMAHQAGSTNHVVTAVQEISALSTQLVATVKEVARASQNTAAFASSGQDNLTNMEDSMKEMEGASKAVSGRLSAINEKAENITNVVTTISKVADQTNLLSLNAAIEAEKAGEYGRGFTVVAREIRRLADQTAVSTLDIEQMVEEMQEAVTAGVMEMDKFISRVQHSAKDVARISSQLSGIIEQVQELTPKFEEVNVAMGQQSENAQSINQAMRELREEVEETKDSISESYSAIEQLNEAAKGLQDLVSRFKVQ